MARIGVVTAVGLGSSSSANSSSSIPTTVDAIEVLGAESIVHGHLGSNVPVTVSVRGISGVRPGAIIRLGFDERFAHVFDGSGSVLEASRSWEEDYLVG